MEVVIDSNVLFRTLISRGDIIKLLFDTKLKLFAPLKLKEEFFNNKDEILSKSYFSEKEFNRLSFLLFKRITFVKLEEYKSFLPKAKKLLETHTKDEDFVALALSRKIKLWTYESLLFEIGVGISTKELSGELSKL